MTQTENFGLAHRGGIVHLSTDALFSERTIQITRVCRKGTISGYVVAPRELHPWEKSCPKCFPQG